MLSATISHKPATTSQTALEPGVQDPGGLPAAQADTVARVLTQHSGKVVAATVSGSPLRALQGSMIAYEGAITFKAAMFGGGDGVLAALKRGATGEGVSLMECSGTGVVYLADEGKYVRILTLSGETLQVESERLLALDGNLRTNVAFAGLRGASSGQGLFTTTVSGQGQVALLSAGGPLIDLEVDDGYPLVVDPDAFVCARGELRQSFVTDVSWRDLVGQGTGEAFSLRWEGRGVVSVQPAER